MDSIGLVYAISLTGRDIVLCVALLLMSQGGCFAKSGERYRSTPFVDDIPLLVPSFWASRSVIPENRDTDMQIILKKDCC